MGIFSNIANIYSGVQGAKLGKQQMKIGQQMLDESKELSAYERPVLDIAEMTTPESINQMVQMASAKRYQNMPGYSQAQNQIGQASAQALKAIQEMGIGSEAIGAAGDIYAQNLAANRDLSMSNASYQDMADKDYMNALQELGGWENRNFMFNTESGMKEFDWNQAQPYLNAQQKAAMLQMMGMQNKWEGLKTKTGSNVETAKGIGGSLDSSMSDLKGILANLFTGGASGAISSGV